METLNLLHDSLDSLLLCLDLQQSVAVIWPVLRELTLRLRDSFNGASNHQPPGAEATATGMEGVWVVLTMPTYTTPTYTIPTYTTTTYTTPTYTTPTYTTPT